MNSLFRIPGVRLIAGISLSIVSVALTFACAELLYRLAVGEPEAVEFIDENLYDANAHEKLGYLPKADNSYTARKSVLDDGRRKSIYEVTYTTDLHHRVEPWVTKYCPARRIYFCSADCPCSVKAFPTSRRYNTS